MADGLALHFRCCGINNVCIIQPGCQKALLSMSFIPKTLTFITILGNYLTTDRSSVSALDSLLQTLPPESVSVSLCPILLFRRLPVQLYMGTLG